MERKFRSSLIFISILCCFWFFYHFYVDNPANSTQVLGPKYSGPGTLKLRGPTTHEPIITSGNDELLPPDDNNQKLSFILLEPIVSPTDKTEQEFADNWSEGSSDGPESTTVYYITPKPDRGKTALIKKKRTAILITTNMRSGSSFTATLFEENPQVVYHFEPLHYAQHNLLNGKIKKNYTCGDGPDHICLHQAPEWIVQELLSGLFRAKIPDFYDSYFRLKNDKNRMLSPHENRRCAKVNMCGRVCPYYQNETAPQTWERSGFITVKSTRVGKLQYLRPLADSDDFNLKIIHLLRDPRGIVNSRKRINAYSMYRRTKSAGEKLIMEDATYLCDRMAGNLRYAKSSDWLTPDNYMMIRYEDIVADPIAAVDRMYRFTGLKMDARVQRFIDAEALQPQKHRDLNPAEITQSWRQHLSKQVVSHLQKSCADILRPEWTGYRPVDVQTMTNSDVVSIEATTFHV